MSARDTDFTPERIAEVRRMNDDLIAEFARAWLEAHDREQRLAGAREAMRELRYLLAERVGSDFRHSRIKDSYDADVISVLEAMEREA